MKIYKKKHLLKNKNTLWSNMELKSNLYAQKLERNHCTTDLI